MSADEYIPEFEVPFAASNDVAHSHTNVSTDDEMTLIVRMREGDVRAFELLMTRYLDDVTRFACYLVHSRDIADDIAQQVFIGLWEYRDTIDQARPIKPYLFRATRNRALNEHKAEAVRERYRSTLQADSGIGGNTLQIGVPSPEDSVVAAEMLRSVFQKLPPRYQLALRLRVIDALEHTEIAQVLGCSPTAARQLVSRAMSDLRKKMRCHTPEG